MTQPAVVLLAHGSSDPNWQKTFEQLAAPTCEAIPNAEIAYMELCAPSMQDIIASQVRGGAREIKVVPLFLARGRHLRKDIPAMIEALKQAYPDVSIDLTAPIGEAPELAMAVKDVVADILARNQ